MENLRSILSNQLPLATREWEAILEKWTVEKNLLRGDYLSKEGQVEGYLYFVNKGTLRIFYLHNDGTEICVGFAYPNTLLCSYPSFISQVPAQYYIQSITPSQLIGIKRSHFYQLMERFPSMEKRWRMLTEAALLGKIEREVEMLTFTPAERYRRLLDRSPHVFQLIPQKYLASYLGMQAETFSRIKSRISK